MRIYDSIPPNLQAWAIKQPVFFIGSAPLTGKHVNCSPKGLTNSTLKIFDEHHCAYIDYSGSGSETIAHCYENGRVTVMFCSFELLPRVLRFFCTGSVIERDDPRFLPMIKKMGKPCDAGQRAIIMLEVWKVTTSCGTGVPLVGREQTAEEEELNGDGNDDRLVPTDVGSVFRDRSSMSKWCNKMEEKGKMDTWQRDYNAESIDGVPAMRWARRERGEFMAWTNLKYSAGRGLSERYGLVLGLALGLLVMFVVLRAGELGGWHEAVTLVQRQRRLLELDALPAVFWGRG